MDNRQIKQYFKNQYYYYKYKYGMQQKSGIF